MGNQQIHKRLIKEQVVAILENYLAKEIFAKEAIAKLELKRSQFFNLVSEYRNGLNDFSIKHKGNNGNRRISADMSSLILEELKAELIEVLGKFEFLAKFEWELASRSDAFPQWHGMRESNPRPWIWSPLLYHLTNPAKITA